MEKSSFAFITLATDDNYSKGALVLANSLRLSKTKHKLVVLVTDGVSNAIRDKLNKVFDLVEDVSTIDSKDDQRLALLERPELGVTLTKLHCWKMIQFSKCVFLDADTLVLKNCDELFEKSELSAVPDVGWPDCFNSGMFVFKPSIETYKKLLKMAAEHGSFDGGDQGLLNMYFSDWATKDISRHLSFIYNMNVSASYTYLPAYKHFGQNVKIVHFLGAQKPWVYYYHKESETLYAPNEKSTLYDYLKLWWKIYSENVEDSVSNVTETVSQMSLSPTKETSTPSPSEEVNLNEEADRLYLWEQGRIDYMGRDSYDNIQKKLDDVINGTKK